MIGQQNSLSCTQRKETKTKVGTSNKKKYFSYNILAHVKTNHIKGLNILEFKCIRREYYERKCFFKNIFLCFYNVLENISVSYITANNIFYLTFSSQIQRQK